ncbi:MAG: hypothetical protein R2932_57865 [Caldilineaceae bacterium]
MRSQKAWVKPWSLIPIKLGRSNAEQITPIWVDLQLGEITQEEAQQKIDELMVEYATEIIADNGWQCQ